MNEVCRDFIGTAIEAGDIVAYPVRRGSDMKLRWMRVAAVDIIRATPIVFKLHGTNDKGDSVRLNNPHYCAVLKKGPHETI